MWNPFRRFFRTDPGQQPIEPAVAQTVADDPQPAAYPATQYQSTNGTAPAALPDNAEGLANNALVTADPNALQRELGLRLHRLVQAYLQDSSRLSDLGADHTSQIQALIGLYDQALHADPRPAWHLERAKLHLQINQLDQAWLDLQQVEPSVTGDQQLPIWKALYNLAGQRHDWAGLVHYVQLIEPVRNDPRLWNQVIERLQRAGQHGQAMRLIELKTRCLESANPHAHRPLSQDVIEQALRSLRLLTDGDTQSQYGHQQAFLELLLHRPDVSAQQLHAELAGKRV